MSTDGGFSFGPTTTFSSHIQDMGTTVAAGDGVVYLAYKTRYYRLLVTRSTNGGASWSSPTVVTTNGYGLFDNLALTASGTHAYLAYTDQNSAWGKVLYRRTVDSGAGWSSDMNLAPGSWTTETPNIALQGGVVRAVYERRTSSGYSIYYQQSTNGLTWSSPEQVDGASFHPVVTKAGNIIVLFSVAGGDAYARTGS